MNRYCDSNVDVFHSPAHLQGVHKFNSTYNSTLISAKTRQALSLPTSKRQPSPQRINTSTKNRQRVSQLLCPISTLIVPTTAYKNNPQWSTHQSRMEEVLNKINQMNTHSSDPMKPWTQNQSTGSIFEEKKGKIDKQQEDVINQNNSPKRRSIVPIHSSLSGFTIQEQSKTPINLCSKENTISTSPSSFDILKIKKSNTKINAIVLAMINKKNSIMKQFMQHQVRPPLTASQNPHGIQQQDIILSKHIGQNKSENLQSSCITGDFSQKQSPKSSFLFKNQIQQVDFQDEKKEQQQLDEIEPVSVASKEIFEFPMSIRKKQHIFMSSDKLSQSNTNTSSSTNTLQKQRQNKSYQRSATTLSRKNSSAQQSQFYKIDQIIEPRKQQESDHKTLRNSNSLSLFMRDQQTSLQTFKQEEETIQKSSQISLQQRLGFANRRSQSAHQSRIKVDCSSSSIYQLNNFDNSAQQFHPRISQFSYNKESNSHLSYSHKALKDEDEESNASDQSSLRSWKGQVIIDEGISIKNVINENRSKSDQIEAKDILADQIQQSNSKLTPKKWTYQMRSQSSRLDNVPLQKTKITVFSSPHGVKKTLCGWSFTNDF